jgi:hypothetical protein
MLEALGETAFPRCELAQLGAAEEAPVHLIIQLLEFAQGQARMRCEATRVA